MTAANATREDWEHLVALLVNVEGDSEIIALEEWLAENCGEEHVHSDQHWTTVGFPTARAKICGGFLGNQLVVIFETDDLQLATAFKLTFG